MDTHTRVWVSLCAVTDPPEHDATRLSPTDQLDVAAWADNVRRRRRALRISQRELGRRAGITQQAVSYIERGLGIPRFTTMLNVARALGATIEDLLPPEARHDDGAETGDDVPPSHT